jgi:hypothetical protein
MYYGIKDRKGIVLLTKGKVTQRTESIIKMQKHS